MKRALALLIASIVVFSMTLGRTSCATLARACHWRGNGFARAARLAAILGGILLTGCAGQPVTRPAPLVLTMPDCPAPTAPVLPPLDATALLDSPENGELLMLHDDLTRTYIDGLRAALTCYRKEKTYESR